MKILFTLLLCSGLYAGQSLNSGATITASLTGQAKSASSRVEFFIHDWDGATSGQILDLTAVGLLVSWTAGPSIQIYNTNETDGSVCSVPVAGATASTGLYIRFQHDATNNVDMCEAWLPDGTKHIPTSLQSFPSRFVQPTSGNYSAGITLVTSHHRSGFVRVSSTLVPANGKMPFASDAASTLLDWKLDGNLNDSSGNGWTGSGSATYSTSPTPGVVSRIRTLKTPYLTSYSAWTAIYNTPWWAQWISLQAGQQNQLSGTDSASQVDSPSITYFWQQLSGPSTLIWDDRTSATPIISGASFGTYRLQLTVGDGTNTATSTLDVGAIATDTKGVVVQADSKADVIFGPMIAYGRSALGRIDERTETMRRLQPAYLTSSGYDKTTPPAWNTPATGTVTFRTQASTGSSTTTTAGINTTDLSIPIADASQLNLSSFPTIVALQSSTYSHEYVLITASTATSGAATLTVAFGGRGIPGKASFDNFTYLNPTSWSSGTVVRQLNMVGSGTNFSGDSLHPLCPAGVPGPAGTVAYSTGTLTVSGAVLTGSGTTWNSGNGAIAGRFIRIAATHSGGTQFTFWARISSVDSTTQITMDKSVPAGTDGSAFSYKIVSQGDQSQSETYMGLTITQDDGRDNFFFYNVSACASDTVATYGEVFDISAIVTGAANSGKTFTTVYGLGQQGFFQPHFYSTGMALRADYHRSGYTPSLEAANGHENYWPRHPEVTGAQGQVFGVGGGRIGAVACLVLGQCSNLDWKDVRKFISASVPASCESADPRDSGYRIGILALGALYDPTSAATWNTALGNWITFRDGCRKADNSYSTGQYFNASPGPSVSFTNGSTAGTGTGLSSSICQGVASGTATATNGSGTLTGTGFVTGGGIGQKVVITGTIGGVTKSLWLDFDYVSSTEITMAGVWPGTTGTVNYTIANNDTFNALSGYLSTWAVDENDTDLDYNYVCTWNSATSITLHRAWQGNTGSHTLYRANLAGRGTQPFLIGIQTLGMRYAKEVPAQSSAATTQAQYGANWYKDTAYSTDIRALQYGEVFEACKRQGSTYNPSFTWPTSGNTRSTNLNCGSGFGYSSTGDRMNIGEGGGTIAQVLYEQSASQSNIDYGDELFASLWCSAPYDVSAPGTCGDNYSGGNSVGAWNLKDADLSIYKWPGFFFGMGMAHRWPAVRLGGVAASDLRTYSYGFTLPSGADKIQLTVLRPSGETVSPTACTTSPCTFTYDARQGKHLVKHEYQTTGGATRSVSDWREIN